MKNKLVTPRFIYVSTAIVLAAVSRLFPHIPNFSPIAAMALFGAVYFENKVLAIIVPLITMVLSDAALEVLTGWGFHNTIPYVYAAFIITSCIGLLVKRNPTVANIVMASVISSVLFFIITNFGYWAGTHFAGGATGLNTAYVMGLPFFAPTMLGDLFFNGILFGSFYLVQRRYPALSPIKVKS